MDNKCGSNVCNRIIAELDDAIQCGGGCKQRFHIKCSTVSPNALKYMTASKNLKFLCDECLQYTPSVLNAKYETLLNLMNEILATVKTENSDLKNKFDDLKNKQWTVVKVFQNNQKNGYNCIIQVDGETFKKLMNEKKIFVGWDRCRVTECVDLLRCYNCSGFQHKSSECKRTKACPRCAENHDLKECKQEKRECANCKFAVHTYHLKLNVDHEAWSPECPTFLRKLNVQRSKKKK